MVPNHLVVFDMCFCKTQLSDFASAFTSKINATIQAQKLILVCTQNSFVILMNLHSLEGLKQFNLKDPFLQEAQELLFKIHMNNMHV